MKYSVLILTLAGCATQGPLAPIAMRQKQYTMETKLKKDAAFDKVQSWAATTGGQMKLNDRVSGTVVNYANVPCSAIKMGNGMLNSSIVWFTLELKVSDKQVMASFTNLKADNSGAWDSGQRPISQVEVDAIVKECIDPIKDSIKATLT